MGRKKKVKNMIEIEPYEPYESTSPEEEEGVDDRTREFPLFSSSSFFCRPRGLRPLGLGSPL